MRRYVQTTLGGLVHLGSPDYDDDTGNFIHPETTLCGLAASTWSKAFVRISVWSKKKPGAVCPTCDRIAMWQTIAANSVQ